MHIKTTLGQVALVGGQRDDRTPGVLVDERGAHLVKGRDRGNLYVLVQLEGYATEGDVVADRLAEVVDEVYYGWRGSVTAGLQEALRQANHLLFEENRNSLPGERRTAGISCVVLRGADLFVAQVGPTAVFLAQRGQVRRFPEVSPWLDGVPPEETEAAALGERRDPNVLLFHSPVNVGDRVLLAECNLAGRVPSQRWPAILFRDTSGQVLEALVTICRGSDMKALLVVLGDLDGEEAEPLPVRPLTAGPEKAIPRSSPQPGLEQVSVWLKKLQVGSRLTAIGRMLVTALAGFWAIFFTFLKRMVPGQMPASERQPTILKQSAQQANRRKPQVSDTGESDRVQRVLMIVAVAIPLIVAAIVVLTYVHRGQVSKAEIDALLQQANEKWAEAGATTDQAVIRSRLNEAQSLIDQVLQLRPDQVEAQDLQKKIAARLDEINQVKRITWIGELNVYPAGAILSRVVVEALQPDSKTSVLVKKGDQVGDVLVGDLVDMVWMPVGDGRPKAALMILESGGALLEFDPATDELRALRVADSSTWTFPKFVGAYYGRFYLLDSGANKIWRYYPTDDGYSSSPDDWLQEDVDMAGVVDMAIGDNIYLLFADGSLRKFEAGKQIPFDLTDWDTPPQNPAAVFVRPPEDAKWIYIADRGHGRIVQCSKEGQFNRQFRLVDSWVQENGDALAQANSFFVDEISAHAYLLSGQKLFLLILPD
jgi:hypothetical protein